MADKTGIAWTDATWNPVTGCAKVSPGCANCYAESVALRFWKTQYPPVEADTAEGAVTRPRVFEDVHCHADRLAQPLKWQRPRRIFVNSMSDLFHPDVPDAFIDNVFAVMALAPQHTFQVLTKRPARMREYLSRVTFGGSIISEPSAYARVVAAMDQPAWLPRGRPFGRVPESWPLPNVHLGVSAENQRMLDERLPILLDTPAAVRFVSAEPLLEGLDIAKHRPGFNRLWFIVGGESGAGARPCELWWIRSIVRQCEEADAPVFVKQLGSNRRGAPPSVEGKGDDPVAWPPDLRVQEFPPCRT